MDLVQNLIYGSDSEDELQIKRIYEFRQFRIYDNPSDFYERFRFTPRLFELLLQEMGPILKPKATTNHALTAQQKLLIFLRFAASNEFYYELQDNQGFIYFMKPFPIILTCFRPIKEYCPKCCKGSCRQSGTSHAQ
jgi:hypothetical protein